MAIAGLMVHRTYLFRNMRSSASLTYQWNVPTCLTLNDTRGGGDQNYVCLSTHTDQN